MFCLFSTKCCVCFLFDLEFHWTQTIPSNPIIFCMTFKMSSVIVLEICFVKTLMRKYMISCCSVILIVRCRLACHRCCVIFRLGEWTGWWPTLWCQRLYVFWCQRWSYRERHWYSITAFSVTCIDGYWWHWKTFPFHFAIICDLWLCEMNECRHVSCRNAWCL